MSYKHICNNIGQATLILSAFFKKIKSYPNNICICYKNTKVLEDL